MTDFIQSRVQNQGEQVEQCQNGVLGGLRVGSFYRAGCFPQGAHGDRGAQGENPLAKRLCEAGEGKMHIPLREGLLTRAVGRGVRGDQNQGAGAELVLLSLVSDCASGLDGPVLPPVGIGGMAQLPFPEGGFAVHEDFDSARGQIG